uniref:uncharacterized protein LOC122604390 n=1 Tax=Erigeron canadensis TaxID=72917 RepID=UPI001CB949C7|nr:uncharacterized protein LOC122604390 [Erigeron canadensis]
MDFDESSGSSNESADYEERVQNVILRVVELVRRREEQPAPIIHRRVPVDRDRIQAHTRLMHDYFADEPRYNTRLFKRRFPMSKNLFERIDGDLEARYPYFQTRYDRAGRRGFTGVQKYTSAIRQLAYGFNSDFLYKYLQMSERTSWEACLQLCVDYMHWPWEMCPAAWLGSYTSGHVGRPLLILQAVASNDLWIWNAYFGQQGSHNDINVFKASPILEEIVNGFTPSTSFWANGNHYEKGYYLGDGIYPEYATFVKKTF